MGLIKPLADTYHDLGGLHHGHNPGIHNLTSTGARRRTAESTATTTFQDSIGKQESEFVATVENLFSFSSHRLFDDRYQTDHEDSFK